MSVWRWETSDVRHQTSDARVAAATVPRDNRNQFSVVSGQKCRAGAPTPANQVLAKRAHILLEVPDAAMVVAARPCHAWQGMWFMVRQAIARMRSGDNGACVAVFLTR